MKSKKLQLLRIGFLSTALFAVVVSQNLFPKTAYAVGDLTVDWGTTNTGDPIFIVENFAPGDCEERTVEVTNSGTTTREVGVQGVSSEDLDALSEVLEITIDKNGSSVYGPKTLAEFFDESEGTKTIGLSNHTSGESADYTFKVCFDSEAGNEFQNTQVIFDLVIGLVLPIPEECEDMDFDDIIFGTSGNNRLRGSGASELIFGLEGNDKIDGGGGDDCIVGGAGNDKMDGGTGKDVISGEAGNDEVDGSSDNDIVLGGEGNDKLDGGSGNDLVFGNSGEDKLEGGSGDDEVYGGDQNDLLDGGSGDDKLYGEDGNDNLKGGSNDDLLDGGAGQNVLSGDSGIDECINGPTIKKCENP